jgi:hypothetical protein
LRSARRSATIPFGIIAGVNRQPCDMLKCRCFENPAYHEVPSVDPAPPHPPAGTHPAFALTPDEQFLAARDAARAGDRAKLEATGANAAGP